MSIVCCSENSAWPRLLLASSAIHCRFVDRFAGSSVPSRVARQWFSTRDASLPSAGSRWARFPGVRSTTKALRLPVPHGPGAHGVRVSAPRRSPRSCFAEALPPGWRSRASQDRLITRPSSPPGPSSRGANTGSPRFPGGPSHASAKLQDPGRTRAGKPLRQAGAAPAAKKTRAPAFRAISGLPLGFSTRCLRFRNSVARPLQDSLPAGWLAFAARASIPLNRFNRFQIIFST
jgi:hypothetical protein